MACDTDTTAHIANGTRYGGSWPTCLPMTEALAAEHSIVLPKGADPSAYVLLLDGRTTWTARADDVFATEAEARAACKARRQPRRPKPQGPALYGDFAMFAAWNGIATDGSGRVNR